MERLPSSGVRRSDGPLDMGARLRRVGARGVARAVGLRVRRPQTQAMERAPSRALPEQHQCRDAREGHERAVAIIPQVQQVSSPRHAMRLLQIFIPLRLVSNARLFSLPRPRVGHLRPRILVRARLRP